MRLLLIFITVILLPNSIDGQWQLKGNKIQGMNFDDRLGQSISLSNDGNRIAIGVTLDDSSGDDAGAVLIYEWNETSWVQLGSKLSGEGNNDQFGSALEISGDGNRLIIGSFRNDQNGSNAGHVRVFEYSNSDWVQLGSDIDGDASEDQFGRAVAISNNGQRIIIGAPLNDDFANNTGKTKVFDFNGNDWVQVGNDILGESIADRSGSSVSINATGDIIAIGAIENNGVAGGNSGHVRVYQYNGSGWIQFGSDIDGEVVGDRFGISLDLSHSGYQFVAGANQNDDAGFLAGHARIFEFQNGDWVQLGNDIDGTAEYRECGFDVSITGDGKRVIIGSPAQANDFGDIRIFQYFGTDWTQIGITLLGELPTDMFGKAVSISSNGEIISGGAPINDNGNVRIFEYGLCVDDTLSKNVIIDGLLKVPDTEFTNCDYPIVVIKPDGTFLQKDPIPVVFSPPQYTTEERDELENLKLGSMIYNITSDCNEIYRSAGWFNICTQQYD